MDRDLEKKKGLAAAGVVKSAWGTTLVLLGAQSLREAVVAKAFTGDEARGAWVYSSSDANHARQVFYCMAKEMFLTGSTVYCVSAMALSRMLMDDDLPESLESAQMVFILDFYESGCARPYEDDAAARMRFWIKGRFESDKPVSFLADAPLSAVTDWWPPSFVSFLAARVTEYGTEGK